MLKSIFTTKIFLIFLCCNLFFTPKLFSQIVDSLDLEHVDSLPEPTLNYRSYSIFKSNPLVLLQGSIPLSSEFRLNFETNIAPKQYFELGVSYLGKGIFLWFEDTAVTKGTPEFSFRGYRLQGQYRWYPMQEENEPMGVYTAFHASYSAAKFAIKQVVISSNYIRIEHYNINLLLGYQTEIIEPFCLDVFAGMGYKKNTWYDHVNRNQFSIYDPEISTYYNSNLKIIIGFNVGFIIN